jgi:Skp family chaperone for outer membrane proteins
VDGHPCRPANCFKIHYNFIFNNAKLFLKTNLLFKMHDSLIPDPYTQQLRRDCEILVAQLATLFTEHEVLTTTILPNILADYQMKLGAPELEKFTLQVEVRRLKKKIALMQEALNHGSQPEIAKIEERLETLFKEWQEQLHMQEQKLEEAQARLKNLGTEEFSAEIRTLYRELVRRLHPDITHRDNEREAMLLQRAMAAYRLSDVEELRALKLLLDSSGAVELSTQTDELLRQKELLQNRIETMLLKISEIKNGDVFNLAEKLESPEWLAGKRAELHTAIHEMELLKTNLLKIIHEMNPKGF